MSYACVFSSITKRHEYLGCKVSIEAGSPHDEPAEDERDAQQGEQTAACGAFISWGGRC